MHQPGIRVIAISHEDDDALYIFGYGVYEGNFMLPSIDLEAAIRFSMADYAEARAEDPSIPEITPEDFRQMVVQHMSNPRIKLDSGKTVWGYECWWSPVDEADIPAGIRIVEIDIDEAREKAKLQVN